MEATGEFTLNILVLHLILGLSRAMIIFMVAAGLSILLGVLRVANFAHGSFYMIGAYLALTVGLQFTPGDNAGFWIAVLSASLGVALLGMLIERGLLRFVYQKEIHLQLLLLFGVGMIISDLTKFTWGVEYRSLPGPSLLTGSLSIMGMRVPSYPLFLIIIGVLTMVGMWFLANKTKIGKISRAAAVDREMVEAAGINATMVFSIVFVIGGLLAGLGGALVVPLIAIGPGIGFAILIKAFIVVIVGGLGNIWGVFLASLIFGLVESYTLLILPAYVTAMPFGVALILLILRPTGLAKPIW